MNRAQHIVYKLLEGDPDVVNPKDYLKKVDFTKYARSYRIVDHGLMFSDYFGGHGTAFTEWEDAATGYGDDIKEAVNDALNMLAESGWDLSIIQPKIDEEMASWSEADIKKVSVDQWIEDNVKPDEEGEREMDNVELPSYIASVDVTQQGEGYDPIQAQPT